MAREIDLDTWQARIVALELTSITGRNILRLVAEQPLSASQIALRLNLPLTTVFYHLSRMELVDLVEANWWFTDTGPRWIKYYRASSSRITFTIGGE